VTRVGGGAITDGQTVYCTYTYALTDADFEFDGRDFRNQQNNDVLGQEGRIAIITDWSKLYSIEWDTSQLYDMTTNNKLYVDANGKATSVSGTDKVGQVSQLPNANDPYMGMILHGNPL
jgi:hypothetical protein